MSLLRGDGTAQTGVSRPLGAAPAAAPARPGPTWIPHMHSCTGRAGMRRRLLCAVAHASLRRSLRGRFHRRLTTTPGFGMAVSRPASEKVRRSPLLSPYSRPQHLLQWGFGYRSEHLDSSSWGDTAPRAIDTHTVAHLHWQLKRSLAGVGATDGSRRDGRHIASAWMVFFGGTAILRHSTIRNLWATIPGAVPLRSVSE